MQTLKTKSDSVSTVSRRDFTPQHIAAAVRKSRKGSREATMQTLKTKSNPVSTVSREDFTPEHIAAAVLMERFAEMSKESFCDLMSLREQWMNPDTPAEDYGEIFETIREILFPELLGGIRFGRAGSVEEVPEKLQRRAEHVGRAIQRIRKEKKLTQKQLAAKSGLPQPHISRLEAGVHSPSMKTLEKVAKALGVAVGDLDPSH